MLNLNSLWRFALLLPLLNISGLSEMSSVSAQVQTSGSCSPVITQSQVTGKIEIQCGAGREDLAKIVERLNRLIDESRMTRSQVSEFAQLLNTFADARSGQSRLSGVMTTWLAHALQSFKPNDNVNIYTSLIDSSDRDFDVGGSESVVFQFYAFDSEDVDPKLSCSIKGDDDMALVGFKSVVREQASGSVSTVQLAASDPVLVRICRGMNLPLASIMSSASKRDGRAANLTVYDSLSFGKSTVALMLLPGLSRNVPADDIRTYWSSAFVARDFGVTPKIDMGPETAADILENVGFDGKISMGRPLTLKLRNLNTKFNNITYAQPYPAATLEEFGSDLKKMDAAWLRYITDAKVTLGRGSFPLFDQGKPKTVLRLYRSIELDSPTFWSEIRDGGDFFQQKTCLAARFAVDQGYVAAGDLTDYGRCAK